MATPDEWLFSGQFFTLWGSSVTGPNATPTMVGAHKMAQARYDEGGRAGGGGRWRDDCDPKDGEDVQFAPAGCGPPFGVRWWTVDVNAWELQRLREDTPGPPAQPAEILKNELRRSKMQARIRYQEAGYGTSFDFDIATGTRIAIHSPYVVVELLLPAQSSMVTGGSGGGGPIVSASRGPGELLDTLVNAAIYDGIAPAVQRHATLTQTVEVAAEATGQITIPPRAMAAEIYVPGAAAATFLNGGLWIDNPDLGAAATLGVLPFTVGPATAGTSLVTTKTDICTRPGNAGALALPNFDEAIRFFTVVWHLEL